MHCMIPVSAEQNINGAYLEVLNNAEQKYGEFADYGYRGKTGIGYAKLIDFNNDGIDELLFCTGESEYNGDDYYRFFYNYHLYTYKDNEAKLLRTDDMDAHGGDANWEISLYTSKGRTTRLAKERYDGVARSNTYISFYEFDGNVVNEAKDAFAIIDRWEYSDGFDYYINGEKVTETEYSSRMNSIAGSDLISINAEDFSGVYLEEVRKALGGGKNIEEAKMLYSEYVTAIYDAFECGYSGYVESGIDANQILASLYIDFAIDRESSIHQYFEAKYGFCTVYNRKEIESVINYKFNIDIDTIFNYADILVYADDEYVVIGAYARGERWPGTEIVLCDVQQFWDGSLYFKWYMKNTQFENDEVSYLMYGVLDKQEMYGKEIIGYKYLSLIPLSEKIIEEYAKEITVLLNGRKIEFDQQPVIKNNRTLVPMRAIFEAMGCEVSWNDGIIDVYKNSSKIMTLKVNDNTVKIYGKDDLYTDTAPMVINSRTLVPVRVISEGIGAEVDWNQDSKTVIIKK